MAMDFQPTGMQDKNGREIFEGDTIEFQKLFIFGTDEGIKIKGVVRWNDQKKAFYVGNDLLADIVERRMLDISGGSVGCQVIGSEDASL